MSRHYLFQAVDKNIDVSKPMKHQNIALFIFRCFTGIMLFKLFIAIRADGDHLATWFITLCWYFAGWDASSRINFRAIMSLHARRIGSHDAPCTASHASMASVITYTLIISKGNLSPINIEASFCHTLRYRNRHQAYKKSKYGFIIISHVISLLN